MDIYKVYNETKSQWEEGIYDAYPVVCPVNPGDVMKPDSPVVVIGDVQTNPNGLPAIVSLDNYKLLRYHAIDTKTGELIMQGFTWDSKVFSMSTNAQINWSNFPNLPDGLFPLNVMDINEDVYVLSLANKTNFYLTALNYKNTQLQSGSVLKAQIKACADEACVNAVIDNR